MTRIEYSIYWTCLSLAEHTICVQNTIKPIWRLIHFNSFWRGSFIISLIVTKKIPVLIIYNITSISTYIYDWRLIHLSSCVQFNSIHFLFDNTPRTSSVGIYLSSTLLLQLIDGRSSVTLVLRFNNFSKGSSRDWLDRGLCDCISKFLPPSNFTTARDTIWCISKTSSITSYSQYRFSSEVLDRSTPLINSMEIIGYVTSCSLYWIDSVRDRGGSTTSRTPSSRDIIVDVPVSFVEEWDEMIRHLKHEVQNLRAKKECLFATTKYVNRGTDLWDIVTRTCVEYIKISN